MSSQHICLVMIVKNEAHVLPRCLSALKPFIDSWVIVDTGSTDNTQEVIQEQLDGVPGEIHESPFESFQKNRSEALDFARARNEADYLLMIDADDTWAPNKDFHWPELTAEGYEIKHVLSGSAFYRPALTRAKSPWRYAGAAHEYMICDAPHRIHRLDDVKIRCGSDGARRKNEPVKKYERVSAILEKEYEENPNNARTVFYLAQSYRDSRRLEDALKFYKERAEMGGWAEEKWYALYQIGVLHERLEHPWEEARDAYLSAYEFRPARNEPLVALASLYRRQKRISEAHVYSIAARSVPYPDKDRLFIDENCYEWRALDEYGIAAQKLGQLKEAKEAILDALLVDEIPPAHRRRIENNLTFSCTPITKEWPVYGDKILVALSTYQSDPSELRKSVDSVLAQTYENFILLIISDGDETPPWDTIKDIDDPRIIRLHNKENIGQFPTYEAILRASKIKYLAIQDDDDVSDPQRLELLMQEMTRTNADVVFSDLQIETAGGKKIYHPSRPEWLAEHREWFAHVGSHVGLWKMESLRRIGGYYGGFRIGADTVVVGLISRLGRPAFFHKVLYFAKRSKFSMTTNPQTGMDTPVRKRVWAEILRLWNTVRKSQCSIMHTRKLVQEGISNDHQSMINDFAQTIKKALENQGQRNENHRTGS